MRQFLLSAFVLVLAAPSVRGQTEIPAGNRAELQEAPPRPGHGDLDERGRVLFEAIKADDPARAMSLFLPREAFRAIKGIADPDGLYDRIIRLYERDIHELHVALGEDAARAEFVRIELSRRRAWVRLREESNRLPYWAQRRNSLVYRVGDEERRFEVRTMIAWDERWYITHLSEFRR
ncbi:MAG: hypothetical protein KF901_06530 [Myxococcales bacterium]|nr:hypothetical protein [Myxococcales bacterium]